MSFVSDGRGCNNVNCPAAMRSNCERAVPVGAGGSTSWTPRRNFANSHNSKLWCDGFSDKNNGRAK